MTVAQFARSSGSVVKTTKCLEIVHSDLKGPMDTPSKGGARYAIVFVDDWTRYAQVYLLKSKTEVLARFKEFKAEAVVLAGGRLRCIRTDNGTEYVNRAFNSFCSSKGIVHQTSVPYSPQHNGLAERMNRSLAEMARAMLYYQHHEEVWWAEAIKSAAYTLNRLPNTARKHSTLYEHFRGKKLAINHLHIFESRDFVHVDHSKRLKWDSKAHKCVFLGYAEASKAYRVWDEEDERVVATRTLILNEAPPAACIDTSTLPSKFQVSHWSDDDVEQVAQPKSLHLDVPEPMDVDVVADDGVTNMEIVNAEDRAIRTRNELVRRNGALGTVEPANPSSST